MIWAGAKASHTVLLHHMGPGEVKSWSEVEKIEHIRRDNAQRHVSTNTAQGQKVSDKGQHAGKTFPYVYFNNNACLHKSSHEQDL